VRRTVGTGNVELEALVAGDASCGDIAARSVVAEAEAKWDGRDIRGAPAGH
jgi:hypothetical protein